MKLKTKKYVFAGLDFIFDSRGLPWFIEANSMPGLRFVRQLYGETLPLEHVACILKPRKNICLVFSRKKKQYHWLIDEFSKYLKAFSVCYSEDNIKSRKMLKTREGIFVHPGAIFRYARIPRSFERSGTLVINPECVRDITQDKLRTIKLLEKNNIRVPKTYFVRNNREFNILIAKKEFDNGFVLKPKKGEGGRGIRIFSKRAYPGIKKPCLLEELITPELIRGRYWDARVFLVNGKVICGLIRESKNPVTNISLGASARKMDKKTLEKLIKPSLQIVRIIDNAAKK